MNHGAGQSGISLEGVAKTYAGGVVGVEQVDLQVNEGELVTVVGASGCGKSTTLRVVAGLETASAGRVRLGNRDVTSLAPHRRHVALLAQRPALHPYWTVARHLEFAWALRHGPRWGSWRWCRQAWRGVAADPAFRRRRDEVSEAWEIEPLLTRRAGELSGGEQQQAALARAMMTDPAAYLFDEPLSSIDVSRRLRFRCRLKQWQRRVGRPVLYVTHDRAEALSLGDRVAVMCRGRVVQCGAPAEVYRRPACRPVVETLATSALNRLEGDVRFDGTEVVLAGATGVVHGRGAARELLRRLRQNGGERLTCAVRPEALRVVRVADSQSAGEEEFRTTGRVIGVERHGDADFVQVQLNGTSDRDGEGLGDEPSVWTARVAAWCDWREDESVELRWSAAQFLAFDSATGENLSR